MHILASKLTRPVPPPQIMDRPHLYSLLDQWRRSPVIFIHAPAGYGKSILASRWLEERGLVSQAGWLSLDPGDDDPLQFLRYLAAALEPILPGTAAAVQPLLDDPQTQPLRTMEVLLGSIQHDPLSVDDNPLILVLDDLHQIDSPAIVPLMTLFLERRPPRLNLMLLGRRATYGPLTRLYAAEQVLDISASDLRFQPDEMETYLVQRGFPPLSGEALARLDARTEGWIVALQLIAAATGNTRDIDELLAVSQSRRGWLAEYLTTQILDGLAPAMRMFLLETSILDRFNASLAAAVSGTLAASARLSSLTESGLPVVQLDCRQEWFRYHHLFQDLLQDQMQQELSSTHIVALHRRAAAWLARHDQVTTAVQHALAADDLSLAADILETAVRPEILRGGTRQAQDWLALLPDNALDQHPRLLVDLCTLRLMRNQASIVNVVERADAALASAQLTPDERRTLEAELYIFKIIAQYIRRDLDGVRELVREVDRYLTDADLVVQGYFTFLQMHLASFEGDTRTALAKGNQAIDTFQEAGFNRIVISVRREQARISADIGRPREALAMLQEIVDTAQPKRSFTIVELISTLLISSNIRYWIDDVEGARRDQQSALELARRLAEPNFVNQIASLASLFDLARATDQSTESKDSWPEAKKSPHPELNRLHLHQLVRQGKIESALHFSTGIGVMDDGKISSKHLLDLVSALEIAVARGVDVDKVSKRIAAAVAQAESVENKYLATRLYALSAWCYLQSGCWEDADCALNQALDLANETGYVRFILDIPALAQLLAVMNHPAAQKMWVATIPEAQRHQATQLSDKERVVLAHLARPARYQDIANSLGISIKTVRTHIRHIYRKLGVTRREEAVARARALGLTAQTDQIP